MAAKDRVARELVHEILRPLGIGTKDMKEHSAKDLTREVRKIVERGQDNELFRRQDGWRKAEDR